MPISVQGPGSNLPSSVLQLLEVSVDASVILDRDRRIHYYNRAYENIASLGRRKLQKAVLDGARCFEIFPLTICKSACVGCKAMETGRFQRMDEIEALGASDDKGEMTFIVTAAAIGDGYWVETYRDVSAEVRIQRRLKHLLRNEREMNASLEEKVQERNQELEFAHAQLVLQEKMSTLGRLVAGIAHELNNPINFVYGNVDFLEQYVEDILSLVALFDKCDQSSETQALVEKKKKEINFDFLVEDCVSLISSIRIGAERTAAIVRDLKNFSRSGANEVHSFDLVSGIETTINLIAPLVKNRIEIHRNYMEGIPKLVCNGGHINQVFMNILTNAAQAIENDGWIRIGIDMVDDGEKVRVIVHDSGHGISDEVIANITDPFFTTKDVGEGSGLGLWITQSIVRKHGGSLSCQCNAGEGARFIVILPIKPIVEQASPIIDTPVEEGQSFG